MKVRKVSQGAYFVQSYSEQTVITFQPTITAQTVTAREFEGEDIDQITTEGEEVFAKQDFKKVVKKTRRKAKK
jgi:hypothetical protein